mmetsp:Transcript_63679/g.141761  ORF Transcript_63679/g.141761 Transcript_63679/m.141761 type:complete len:395 (+) Transcript_63679:48-1232(+)
MPPAAMAGAPEHVLIGSEGSEASWTVSMENSSTSGSETGDSWENLEPNFPESELEEEDTELRADTTHPPPPPPVPSPSAPVTPSVRWPQEQAPRREPFRVKERMGVFREFLNCLFLVGMIFLLWRLVNAPSLTSESQANLQRRPAEDTPSQDVKGCPDVLRQLEEDRKRSDSERATWMMDFYETVRKDSEEKCESKLSSLLNDAAKVRKDSEEKCELKLAAVSKEAAKVRSQLQRCARQQADAEEHAKDDAKLRASAIQCDADKSDSWKQKYFESLANLALAEDSSTKAIENAKKEMREKDRQIEELERLVREQREFRKPKGRQEDAQGHPWWYNHVEDFRQRVREWERQGRQEQEDLREHVHGRLREFWQGGETAVCRLARRLGLKKEPGCEQ